MPYKPKIRRLRMVLRDGQLVPWGDLYGNRRNEHTESVTANGKDNGKVRRQKPKASTSEDNCAPNKDKTGTEKNIKSEISSKKPPRKSKANHGIVVNKNQDVTLDETNIDFTQMGGPSNQDVKKNNLGITQKRNSKELTQAVTLNEENLLTVKKKGLIAQKSNTKKKILDASPEEGNLDTAKKKSIVVSRASSSKKKSLDATPEEEYLVDVKKKKIPQKKSSKKKSLEVKLEEENLDVTQKNCLGSTKKKSLDSAQQESQKNGKNIVPSSSHQMTVLKQPFPTAPTHSNVPGHVPSKTDVAGFENKQTSVQIKQEKLTPSKNNINMGAVKKERNVPEIEAIKRKILEEKAIYAKSNPDRKQATPSTQSKKSKFPSPVSSSDVCSCSECEVSSSSSENYSCSCSEHEDYSCSCSECDYFR